MSSSSLSQRPPAREEARAATRPSKAAASADKAGHYNRRTRRLLERYKAALPEPVRDYLRASLSAESAVRNGRKTGPAVYVDDFCDALEAFAPYVAAGRLPGYGPLRARYGVELVRDVVPLLVGFVGQRREVRAAVSEQRKALSLTDAGRGEAAVALGCVLAGDVAPGLGALAPRSRSRKERVASAEELVAQAERVQAEVPAELLLDAGLTPAALASLQGSVQATAEAGAARDEKATARQLLRAQLAEPCGRIRHELRVLLTAARAARKKDPGIPRFTSKLFPRGVAREDAEPEPAPTPDPA